MSEILPVLNNKLVNIRQAILLSEGEEFMQSMLLKLEYDACMLPQAVHTSMQKFYTEAQISRDLRFISHALVRACITSKPNISFSNEVN